MLRSRHTWPLVGLGVVVAAAMAIVAFGIDWLPPAAAEEADRHDSLLWFVVISSAVIFTIVVVFLLYSIWRWRVDDSDDQDGPPLHGHTKLEIIWTAIPALLLGVVIVYSYLVMSANEATAKDQVPVQVVSQQFAWHFTYPEAGVTVGDLVMPVNRQTKLTMTAKDVIHSFYVPEFRLKMDNVPGISTRLLITPTKTGTFPIICTELCGIGHSLMRSRAIVMTQEDFDAWLQRAKQTASSGSPAIAPARPPASTPSATP